MRKLIILTLLCSLTPLTGSYAQWGWFPLNSGVTSSLNDVFTYFSAGWVVGNNGMILKTTNSGQNWFTQPSGTSANLKSVDFVFRYYSTGFGCISGSSGTILITSNSGNSWTNVNSSVTSDLNSIFVLRDTMTVISVGSNGTIVKSTNQGLTWAQKISPTTVSLRAVAQSYGDYVCVVGQGGIVLVSDDLGESWGQYTGGTPNDLNSIVQYTNYYAHLIAVGNSGTILKSSNAGFNWETVPSGTSLNLYSVGHVELSNYPLNIPYQYVSGANGTILVSSDSGSSWQRQYVPTTELLNSIHFDDINTGYAVGTNGTIFKTVSNHYYIDQKKLDANSISAWYMNDGSFNSNRGFEWPKGSGKYAVYQSGVCIGAVVGSDTLVATAMHEAEYFPGFINDNGSAFGKNDSNYRVYRLSYGINNFDRQKWPNSLLGNSNQGAPVFFDSILNSWKPLDFGTQTMYYCYTDGYPESHQNFFGGRTAPLKADIKQLSFALDFTGGLGNAIFTQFTVINRSTSLWRDVYITIWSDDDIGDQRNDKIGCDSALKLGYTYNGVNTDTSYGSAPPAVGFVLLRGALYFTGNNNDTVSICRNKTKSFITGYKDLGMRVFNYSKNGDMYYPDPTSYYETYRLMKGLYINGSNIIHPNGYITGLMFSGDPVTGTGWNLNSQGDVRYYISTGPINMNPGDTQIIVTAEVISRGTSNLNSITVLRQYVNQIKQYYDSCFNPFPIGIINSSEIVKSYRLYQNYPNPFNPKSKIKYEIAKISHVSLIIYDVLGREIALLVNQQLKPGTYEVEWDGTNYPSGVYFYKLSAGDYVATKKMVLIK